MAADSTLATLAVEFSAKNSAAVDKAIDSKKSRLMQAAGAATTFAKSVASGMASAVDRVGSLGQKVLAVGGLLSGGLLAKGLSGTAEATTLGNAFTILGRVLGDIAAPAIRAFTQFIIEAADWILHLDDATKQNILRWSLFAGALAGFAASLPTLLNALKLITSALSVMMSKWVAIPALIIGVGVALIYLVGEGETFEERMVSGIGNIAKAWVGLKATVAGAGAYLSSIWKDIVKDVKFTFGMEGGERVKFMDSLKQAEKAADAAHFQVIKNEFFQTEKKARDMAKAIFDLKRNIAEGIADLPQMAFEGANDLIGGGRLDRIAEAFADKRPLQVKHEINFQSLQSSWERLQKATEGTAQDQQIEQLENIRRGIDKMNNEGVKVKNAAPLVR